VCAEYLFDITPEDDGEDHRLVVELWNGDPSEGGTILGQAVVEEPLKCRDAGEAGLKVALTMKDDAGNEVWLCVFVCLCLFVCGVMMNETDRWFWIYVSAELLCGYVILSLC
jgi:hypothetical protein